VVLDQGQVLDQAAEGHRGRAEGAPHRVDVQPAGLPGEGAPVAVQRTEEGLDFAGSGGEGPRDQFGGLAHADEGRTGPDGRHTDVRMPIANRGFAGAAAGGMLGGCHLMS